MLINLFTKADWNSSGYLTAVEFREILDSLDLGVTSFQQTILLAEADENEDGKIQYERARASDASATGKCCGFGSFARAQRSALLLRKRASSLGGCRGETPRP
jgi:hypothetical protein